MTTPPGERAPRPYGPESGGQPRSAALAAGTDARPSYDGRTSLLNPGTVGQPRDGDPRSNWDADARVASWHRVAYSIEAVVVGDARGRAAHPPGRAAPHGL